MAYLSTGSYYGDPVRIPALGQYDMNRRAMMVAECIFVSGASDGTPSATSDTDADLFFDTQDTDIALFNIEADSDYDDQGVLVSAVRPVVITAFTASVTATIGDTENAAGWAADAAFDVSSSADKCIMVPGSDDVDDDTFEYNNALGKHYATSSGAIEIIIAGTTNVAAGRLAVYASYFMCNRGGGG